MEMCVLFWQVHINSSNDVIAVFEYIIRKTEAAFVQICTFSTSCRLHIAYPKDEKLGEGETYVFASKATFNYTLLYMCIKTYYLFFRYFSTI